MLGVSASVLAAVRRIWNLIHPYIIYLLAADRTGSVRLSREGLLASFSSVQRILSFKNIFYFSYNSQVMNQISLLSPLVLTFSSIIKVAGTVNQSFQLSYQVTTKTISDIIGIFVRHVMYFLYRQTKNLFPNILEF